MHNANSYNTQYTHWQFIFSNSLMLCFIILLFLMHHTLGHFSLDFPFVSPLGIACICISLLSHSREIHAYKPFLSHCPSFTKHAFHGIHSFIQVHYAHFLYTHTHNAIIMHEHGKYPPNST